jgi:hypothetical protein
MKSQTPTELGPIPDGREVAVLVGEEGELRRVRAFDRRRVRGADEIVAAGDDRDSARRDSTIQELGLLVIQERV